MSQIYTLPPEIVSQIAAGEVIERPAFVLKELLENSLDAGATRIDVRMEESGLQQLVVHDNGEGMTREDLEKSYFPHTTSKLVPTSGFSHIQTLGFRGEALHSISVISRLRIQSRPKGGIGGSGEEGSRSVSGTKASAASTAAGAEIIVEKGKLVESRKVGMPAGTTVVVEDLFVSTPVRKKFLKSGATEFRILLDIFTQTALAWPEVGFRLVHNRKLVCDLPQGQELSERIESLFGEISTAHLLPVSLQDGDILVNGYISKPLSDRVTQKQFYIINKRQVSYQLFSNHIKFAYGSLLEPRKQPFVVLSFTLPHHYLDVNIHPRKEQIHVMNEQSVAQLLQKTVAATLQQNNLTFMPDGADMLRDGGTKTYAAKELKKSVDPWGREFTEWKVSGDVLQVHNLYLIVQSKKGILMVDQHAAHERILYEQFLEEFQLQKAKNEVVHLPKALIFEMSLSDSETLREHLSEFQDIGFDVEEFGTNLFKLNTVPKLFQDRDAIALILEIITDIQSGLGGGILDSIDAKTNRMLSYLACRTAIKSGDKLTKEQAKDLIKKLEECKTQYTCPHGRPAKVEIEEKELEKMFHRR